jgi:hypothetical protein
VTATALLAAVTSDPVSDAIGGAADGVGQATADALLRAVNTWLLDGVVWTVRAVFSFFDSATSPNLRAAWFAGPDGPYAATLAVAAALLVGFVLLAVTQGVLAGDVGGILGHAALRLPAGVLAMVATIGVTQTAIAATDAVAAGFLARFADDSAHSAAVIQEALPPAGTTPPIGVALVALVAIVAGLVVVAELVVRSALIYLVVALAPLAFAAQVWPALRGSARRLLEILAALVLSKLAIAIALAVAGAAMAAPTTGTPLGSSAATVGVVLTAAAAFGVAAFSPFLIHRLLPLTEAAAIAQGTSGGPARAGRTAMATTNGAAATAHRLGLLTGPAAPAATAAAGATGGAATAVAATRSRAAAAVGEAV